ncbi:MAG: His/Gly/Thr/Pro-type tRNA ligase C-terminal domain-containing protein [Candidatus Pacebacteria bacterium]|nr:His/Gly/Thr/Pro-type tRNA ligase C-terminal domain-containing protein [Candidatus Paceibacterota bacterium]
MRQSQLFTKTRKLAPADEVSKNAQLLVRAGFVHKEAAGIYSFLPLGLRVLNNIVRIIREEMNTIGGQELSMSALQNAELWKKTDRWEQDVWFKTELKAAGETGFGWTHEEPITHIASQYVSSYRDLPFAAYQIQTKFRNEERAKSGVMRGREFLMKDLYSFHADQADLDAFYEKATQAYRNVFSRVGLGERTFITFASGGAFSKYSHEFQTLCSAGEDTIYISREKNIAINKEVLTDEVLADLGIERTSLEEAPAVEVGNIFKLGTRFSEPLGLSYTDAEGKKHPVVMGCYGIGPSRLVGALVETLADEKGLVWPEAVAPFKYHLVSLGHDGDDVSKAADTLYDDLTKADVEVLYDDRDLRAGEKFAESDLLGIPKRIVVGKESVATGEFEVVDRATGKVEKKSRVEVLAQ